MPYITVDHENSGPVDLYFEDHGEGQPVILIHGWPLSSRSWEKQVPALLKAGHRVIVYDRRGFGLSGRPAVGYDYDTLAKDLNVIMTKLDLREATLVGFSMGGGEVARFLGTYGTERVNRAVFISSITPFLLKTRDNSDGLDAKLFERIKVSVDADRPAFLATFLSDFYSLEVWRGKRISEPVVQHSWNIAVSASPIGTLECVQAWLTDFRKDIASIRIPTLIIHGGEDLVLPVANTGVPLQKSLPHSEFQVIEGAPHGLLWTHHDQVNSILIKFLGQGGAAEQERESA